MTPGMKARPEGTLSAGQAVPPGIRRTKLLHAWRQPAQPRPAATVLLLREHEGQLEVLMTRRSLQASFAPGAFVFPGGVVDTDDAQAVDCDPALLDHPQPDDLSSAHRDALHRIYAQTALREAWEEVRLLLAESLADREIRANGSAFSGSPGEGLQRAIAGMARFPGEGFSQALRHYGLRARIEAVRSFSHWTTDRDLPKRFDVRFLVAAAPVGQHAIADESEQFEPRWVNPAQALSRHREGVFPLLFPTIRTLEQLQGFATPDAVVAHAEQEFAQNRLWRSCPRGGLLKGQDTRYTEDEAPFAELEMRHPDGQVLHALDWQHEKAVGLLSYLYRLTAPNPGRMTGPGTNTYLLGEPGHWTVVDPGPDIDLHVERIRDFTEDRIVRILCTHSHQDHSPGAFALQAAILRHGGARVPILGRPSGASVPQDQAFVPDRTLEDGERIAILSDTHLRVIHTPGHASNHLCFLIEEDALLLSGDHIMNGSTVVINPPDGDMRAYLSALRRLETLELRYILPAHGYVLGHPAREIRKLIGHRLQREARVLESLHQLHKREAGEATRRSGQAPVEAEPGRGFAVEAIVPGAYAEVSPALYPLAARSLLAHLIKLEAEGLVHQAGSGWRLGQFTAPALQSS